MGYEFLVIRTEVLDVNPLFGEDTYNGSFSKPTCAELGLATGCTVPTDATSTGSYGVADFIFGLPNVINLGTDIAVNLRQHVHSLYVQDDFRVMPKLTLNAGLRWDFATPLYTNTGLVPASARLQVTSHARSDFCRGWQFSGGQVSSRASEMTLRCVAR